MNQIQNDIDDQIVEDQQIIKPTGRTNFIEANTLKVSLQHLKDECTIPVFSKDNETTISHFQFINKTLEVAHRMFPEFRPIEPDIRVSHIIKGRIPSAIGKPAKDLLEHEKTLYYERCAFVIELENSARDINGNSLVLSVGGVRALNQESLYSKKSVEKFKIFIGYQNRVCTNLCISTDGFTNELRITSVEELEGGFEKLLSQYDAEYHLESMERMMNYELSEKQFAHLIGKIRMFTHLSKSEQGTIYPYSLNDGQLNCVIRDYYTCPNFSKDANGMISLWSIYNLLTDANKSSYIDNNLERNVAAYEFINYLHNSLKNGESNWFTII